MQMTDKDKQSTIEKKYSNSKLWIVYIMLVLGVGILVALYINFQLTYKVDNINQKISKMNSNQSNISNLSKAYSPAQNSIPITEENILNKGSKEEEPFFEPYVVSHEFIQDFYLMKSRAKKGDDFTAQLLELKRYTISSNEIKQCLNSLLNLAPNNKKEAYFKVGFNNIIRDIYQQHYKSNFLNLNNYIFIRPIGERALENGGLDQQVVLIEQALTQNNLQKVYDHLHKLPQSIESLANFKQEIENQLTIQNRLDLIESILLNKKNSNIVSK